MEKKNLSQRMIKDIADFYKATGNKPTKILVTEEVFEYLKSNGLLVKRYPGGAYQFEGFLLSITDNINKDWIVI